MAAKKNNGFLLAIILLVIAAAIIATLVFAGMSRDNITKITIPSSKWKKNPDLKDAHSMLSWVVIGGWIMAVILAVVIFFTLLREGLVSGLGAGGSHIFVLITILGVSALSVAIGVLVILAAQNLKKAPDNKLAPFNNTQTQYSKAYNDAIIAASIAVGVVGLLVLVWIIMLASRHAARASGVEESKAELEKELSGAKGEKAKEKAEAEERREKTKEEVALATSESRDIERDLRNEQRREQAHVESQLKVENERVAAEQAAREKIAAQRAGGAGDDTGGTVSSTAGAYYGSQKCTTREINGKEYTNCTKPTVLPPPPPPEKPTVVRPTAPAPRRQPRSCATFKSSGVCNKQAACEWNTAADVCLTKPTSSTE